MIDEQFINNHGARFTVIGYENAKSVSIAFHDPYAYQCTVRAEHIRTGSIKNPYYPSVVGVGYFGEGEHKATLKGKVTRAYNAWRHMLMRCYDERTQAVQPTYIGCSVDACWFNFQVFAEWFTKRDMGAGWELDKDIIVSGNKIYSPDKCAMVPSCINLILTDNGASRGELPIGVTLSNGRYMARVRVNNKSEYIGMFGTPSEAHRAYLLRKSEEIRDAVQRWSGSLSDEVLASLLLMASNMKSIAGEG